MKLNNFEILYWEDVLVRVAASFGPKMASEQGRSHQIWNDQVGSACARMLGGSGGMLLQKNVGAMRLLLRPVLG